MNNQIKRALPIINFKNLKSSIKLERQQELTKLREAAHLTGFFYLSDVQFDFKKAFSISKRFFDLDLEEKRKCGQSKQKNFRGYQDMGGEITNMISDQKETIDYGIDSQEKTEKEYHILLGSNPYPNEKVIGKDWKTELKNIQQEMLDIGLVLMQNISESMYLEKDYFDQYFSKDQFNVFRMSKYQARDSNSQGNNQGIGAHTDYGALIMLMQDHVGGLNVKTVENEWIVVPPIENTFVVNFGDMLNIWTNDYIRATEHRVVNSSNEQRYSIISFIEPSLDTVVKPIELPSQLQFLRPQHTLPNSQMIYGEHIYNAYVRSFPQSKVN